jgi:hypothetical protein
MLMLGRVLATVAIAALSVAVLLGLPPRPSQPGAVGSPEVVAVASLEPGPVLSPEGDAPIVWDSGSVRLEADALEIRAGDKVFHGQVPYEVHSDPGDPSYRTLEVQWHEDGVEQRINIYFAADELDWWIDEIWTRDGRRDADWLMFRAPDLFVATARGETYEGDLHLVDGFSTREGREDVTGELTISGLRLTAFAPGTGPAPLTDCEMVRASVRSGADEPIDKGQPLAGTGIEEMTPDDAEALLREMGLCFTFRYMYDIDDEGNGFTERWCTAPPAGEIVAVPYNEGEIVVMVRDHSILPPREQPPEGWGCPAV